MNSNHGGSDGDLDDDGCLDASEDMDIDNDGIDNEIDNCQDNPTSCLLYTSPSPRDRTRSRMPSSA